jgi:hypothetical protein
MGILNGVARVVILRRRCGKYNDYARSAELNGANLLNWLKFKGSRERCCGWEKVVDGTRGSWG